MTPNNRIHARIPDDLAAALDAYTKPPEGPPLSRTAAIVHLLRAGLAAAKHGTSRTFARVVRPRARAARRRATR